jgi:hypothetical protein
MHKTKRPILYSSQLPVRSGAAGIINAVAACFSPLVPSYPGTTSRRKLYTTIKNNKSISLPASNENTG